MVNLLPVREPNGEVHFIHQADPLLQGTTLSENSDGSYSIEDATDEVRGAIKSLPSQQDIEDIQQ